MPEQDDQSRVDGVPSDRPLGSTASSHKRQSPLVSKEEFLRFVSIRNATFHALSHDVSMDSLKFLLNAWVLRTDPPNRTQATNAVDPQVQPQESSVRAPETSCSTCAILDAQVRDLLAQLKAKDDAIFDMAENFRASELLGYPQFAGIADDLRRLITKHDALARGPSGATPRADRISADTATGEK